MDTWETEKQKWYKATHCKPNDLNASSNFIEAGFREFEKAEEYQSPDLYYKGHHIILLMRNFFEKKRRLEEVCFFCNVEYCSDSGLVTYKYDLFLNGTIYYFYNNEERFLTADNPHILSIKALPGVPDTKAHRGLIAKWFQFMKRNGYFESLKAFAYKTSADTTSR